MRCAKCGRDPEFTSPATRRYREATCGQCATAWDISEKARLEKLRLERLIREEAEKQMKEYRNES